MARATAIGLMSGTSYDGVDVALIETDGEEIGRLGPTGYRPYSDPEREVVRRAIAVAANLTDRSARPAMLAEAEELVTDMHAEAVEAFLAANGMPPSEVAVVGGLRPLAHGAPGGWRGPGRGRGQSGRGRGGACAQASFLCHAAAQIARSQRVPPLGDGGRTPCQQEHGRRRCDAYRHHGRGG